MTAHEWLLNDYREIELRPPSLPLLKHRRALTSIMPGYARRLGGVKVRRTEAWKDYRYQIKGVELTLEQALEVVMGNRLSIAPAPRVFPTAIDHTEIVPTVLLPLPLFAGMEAA